MRACVDELLAEGALRPRSILGLRRLEPDISSPIPLRVGFEVTNRLRPSCTDRSI